MSLTISSAGVSPSCVGENNLPNLARPQPFDPATIAEVTATAEAELREAGIEVAMLWNVIQGEVPSLAFGSLSMWSFKRAWYYWCAEGPGLPVEVAEKLHAELGREVRVAGHCGCPSPREWYKGFGVGSYHVDTQRGLNALAAAILSVYDASKDPDATPRTGKRSD
jgi:hypothetical protein